MKTAPLFLTIEQLLDIHRRMIVEFGGQPAIRDHGLLESAVAMPAAQFGGEFLHPTLSAMAAAYLFHVCKNHTFVDGNKRAALAAAEMFVRLNGAKLKASNRELETLTLGVADGSLSKEQAIDFFEKHVVPSP